MGLDELRVKIDSIDKEIVGLIEKRLDVARDIGLYKKSQGLNILDSSREKEVLQKNLGYVEAEGKKEYIKEILEKIMSVSRNTQSEVIIDEETGEVYGVHILHSEATELISEAAVIRSHEGIAASVVDTIHPHPTLSEAMMEAMALAIGRPMSL